MNLMTQLWAQASRWLRSLRVLLVRRVLLSQPVLLWRWAQQAVAVALFALVQVQPEQLLGHYHTRQAQSPLPHTR